MIQVKSKKYILKQKKKSVQCTRLHLVVYSEGRCTEPCPYKQREAVSKI